MAREMEKSMKPLYSTKTEFIREAIRDKILDVKRKKELIEHFAKYYGKAGIKTTEEQNRKAREEVAKEYAKKFGLD